jgi:hypothetical protein
VPALSEEQIRQAIAAGEVTAITLDTTCFNENGLRLESGLLKRLEQFAAAPIGFVLSDVVFKETLAHLTRKAGSAQDQLAKAVDYRGKLTLAT